MKMFEKFGKEIMYDVANKGAWIMIREGRDKWAYTTNTSMDMPDLGTYPVYVNRGGMWDLLVHFGCDQRDIDSLFKD